MTKTISDFYRTHRAGFLPKPQPTQYGDGTTRAFNAPAFPRTLPPEAYEVVVDGIQQSAVDSFYTDEPNKIKFFVAPPIGATIDITRLNIQDHTPYGDATALSIVPMGGVEGDRLPLNEAIVKQAIEQAGLVCRDIASVRTLEDIAGHSHSLNSLKEGTVINWLGYYSEKDGVSGKGVLRFGTATDDGGSILVLSDDRYIETLMPNDRVDVKQFGARGDGVTDDTLAFQRAFAYAETHSLRVYASGRYVVVAGMLSSRALFDFRDATFLVYSGTGSVLTLITSQTWEGVTGEINVNELRQGRSYLPSLARHKGKLLKITSNELDIYRASGSLSSDGTPQPQVPMYKGETNLLNNYSADIGPGWLGYPIIYDYASVASVVVRKLDTSAEVFLPTFICYSTERLTLFYCTRDFTTVTGGTYREGSRLDESTQPVTTGISFSSCHGCSSIGFTSDYFSNPLTPYGYTVLGSFISGLKINRLDATGSWAAFDGNYMRDIKVENSRGSRFGGHYSCWDMEFESCFSERGFQGSGGGKYVLRNCSTTVEAILMSLRNDYGCRFRGDIYLDSCFAMSNDGATWAWRDRLFDATLNLKPDELFNSSEPLGITGNIYLTNMSLVAETDDDFSQIVRIGNSSTTFWGEDFNFPTILKLENCVFRNMRVDVIYQGAASPQPAKMSVIYDSCVFDPSKGMYPLDMPYCFLPTGGAEDVTTYPRVIFNNCIGLKFRPNRYLSMIDVTGSDCYGMITPPLDITNYYMINFHSCRLFAGDYGIVGTASHFNSCRIESDGVNLFASGHCQAKWITGCYISPSLTMPSHYGDVVEGTALTSAFFFPRMWHQTNGRVHSVCMKVQDNVHIIKGAYYCTQSGHIYQARQIKESALQVAPYTWSSGATRVFGVCYLYGGELYLSMSSGTFSSDVPTSLPRDFKNAANSLLYVGPYEGAPVTEFDGGTAWTFNHSTDDVITVAETVFVKVGQINQIPAEQP